MHHFSSDRHICVLNMSSHKATTLAPLVPSWQQLNNLKRQVDTPLSSPLAISLSTCLPLFPSLSISELCSHCVLSLCSPLSNTKSQISTLSKFPKKLGCSCYWSRLSTRLDVQGLSQISLTGMPRIETYLCTCLHQHSSCTSSGPFSQVVCWNQTSLFVYNLILVQLQADVENLKRTASNFVGRSHIMCISSEICGCFIFAVSIN